MSRSRPSSAAPAARRHGAGWRTLALAAFTLLGSGALSLAITQAPPDPDYPDLQPELRAIECPVYEGNGGSEAERRRYEEWTRYGEVLPAYFAKVGPEPDAELLMPIEGVRVRDMTDTWGAARSEGRSHEGQDIFAPTGTPILSATEGFVYSISDVALGGQSVTVVGDAGRRYFYTHMSGVAPDLREGQFVTTDTVLGYVGNDGNASTTPPHLHFSVYVGELETCEWRAINPYPLLVDRR